MPNNFALAVLHIVQYGLVLLILAAVVAVVVMYIADVTQNTHSIRRNYPVIGRFRYW